EVRARGAITIVIAEEGDEAVEAYANHIIRIPQAPTLMQPLLATVPLQIFACKVAEAKGYDVDQPRNLAKSVTVEEPTYNKPMSLLSTRINLDAISHNVRRLKELVGPDVRLMCVVKADAYGHGVEKVAPIMLKAGADVLGCATVDEA